MNARGVNWKEIRPQASWFDPFFVSMVDPVLDVLAQLPCNRPSLLHLGCGIGVKTETFRRLGYNATGIDLSVSRLHRAERSFPETPFVRGDIQTLPFQDASFDIVFSFSTLQLVPDKQRVIEESARVLRTSGRAVFIENLRGNPLVRGYRAIYSALGFRYPPLETPKAHLDLPEIELFERCFSSIAISFFHLTTPITLVVPAVMSMLWKSSMHVQSEMVYRVLARIDRSVLNRFKPARKFAWHVVATMVR